MATHVRVLQQFADTPPPTHDHHTARSLSLGQAAALAGEAGRLFVGEAFTVNGAGGGDKGGAGGACRRVWVETAQGGALRCEGWTLELAGGQAQAQAQAQIQTKTQEYEQQHDVVVLRRTGRVEHPAALVNFTALGLAQPPAEAAREPLVLRSMRAVADVSLNTLLAAAAAPAARNLWCQGARVSPRAPGRRKGADANAERALAALVGAVDGETLGALQPAGELAALLAGSRGVMMVQVALRSEPGLSMMDMPFVWQLLQRAAADGELSALSSVLQADGSASRGKGSAEGVLGTTAVFYAAREPWDARARLLSSFGAQSSLVAGSTYYKALVGLALDYDAASVRDYCAEMGDPLTGEVEAEALAALQRASGEKAALPWRRLHDGRPAAAQKKKARSRGFGG